MSLSPPDSLRIPKHPMRAAPWALLLAVLMGSGLVDWAPTADNIYGDFLHLYPGNRSERNTDFFPDSTVAIVYFLPSVWTLRVIKVTQTKLSLNRLPRPSLPFQTPPLRLTMIFFTAIQTHSDMSQAKVFFVGLLDRLGFLSKFLQF